MGLELAKNKNTEVKTPIKRKSIKSTTEQKLQQIALKIPFELYKTIKQKALDKDCTFRDILISSLQNEAKRKG